MVYCTCGCVFLKLGESIYVAMDLIPIHLGSLPLAHNVASVPGLPRSVRVLIMRRRQTFEKRGRPGTEATHNAQRTTLRAPHLPRPIDFTGTRRGRQLNAYVLIILLNGPDLDTRCAHSYVSAILRRLSSYVTQGAGRPSWRLVFSEEWKLY